VKTVGRAIASAVVTGRESGIELSPYLTATLTDFQEE